MPRADAASLVARLTARGLRVAVAESLTGGLVAAELTSVPGASLVVSGGVVAYDTAVKRSLLGVDAALLEREGPVHPEVARQMARGVRRALAVDGRSADLGLATTGVAGPDWQGGRPPGTVYVGVSFGDDDAAIELSLAGDRTGIRRATVQAVIELALRRLEG
ncbi:CinA family protein [Agromyces sp. NPDC058136]|uniref:CinA family protein n=1 Tax=Agromyces sp. NPDC058136 TaxID=3346354 RepID=UPI0036DEE5B8